MHLLTLEEQKLENKQPNSLTNFVGISIDWTAFLLSKFVIRFAVFSSATAWKENEELVFFVRFLIAMTLGWFSYLYIAFSIRLWEMFVALRNSCSVFIPKFGTVFTKKIIKNICDFLFISYQFTILICFSMIIFWCKRGVSPYSRMFYYHLYHSGQGFCNNSF